MREKYWIVFTFAFLVGSIQGMDGIEYLKENRWIESAVVTSKSLTLKLTPLPFHVAQNDIRAPWRGAWDYVEKDEAVVLDPEQWTWLIARHSRVMFTPVSFKNKRKGFRVTRWVIGSGPDIPPVITYIVLSDKPMEASEADVKMVKDNGIWVKAEDSRSLELEKLGDKAEHVIKTAHIIMQNPSAMADKLSRPEAIEYWNMLVDRGFLKYPKLPLQPEAEGGVMIVSPPICTDELIIRNKRLEAEDEGQVKPNNFWLYVGISLCVLIPILYFLWRKLKTGN